MRNYILLAVSIVTGILAFFIARQELDKARRAAGIDKTVDVLFFTADMTAGQEIKPENIRARTVISAQRDPAAVIYDISTDERKKESNARLMDIFGRRMAVDKKAGSTLLTTDYNILEDTRKGSTLASAIPKVRMTATETTSYRALSLPIDLPGSVSNMVQPGDRVDIIGTFRFPGAEKGSPLDTITMTILQNITVLAVGQQLTAVRTTGADGRRSSYPTITLQVTPKEAEFLVFAQQKGALTFTLRNGTDPYVASDVQNVNFDYLRENIKKYTEERKQRESMPLIGPRRP